MSFNKVALVRMSRQSVCRGEVVTNNLIRRCSRRIYTDMRRSWGTSGSSDSFNIHATTFFSDATNSSVWKRKKLNSTIIEKTWVKVVDKEFGGGTPLEWWKNAAESRTSLCDIQVVEDGTGAGQIAMLIKQFKSVGVPTWLDCKSAVLNKADITTSITITNANTIIKYSPV